MSEKAKKVGRKSQAERRKALVEELWGDELEEIPIWTRHHNDGYATIPRTLPHVSRILDELSGSGSPLSQVYTALWCRVSDEGFIEIRDKDSLAYESGFSGQRAVTTWSGRMKKLQELGFISCKSGASGEYQYVLIVHPLVVIKKIYSEGKRVKDQRYHALAARVIEVGASWE
ncbi:hypothetical protein [Aeromonas sanarellii]